MPEVVNLSEMREFKYSEGYFERKILDSILEDDLAKGQYYGKVLAALRGEHAKYLAGEVPKNQGQRADYVFVDEISPKIEDSMKEFLDFVVSIASQFNPLDYSI